MQLGRLVFWGLCVPAVFTRYKQHNRLRIEVLLRLLNARLTPVLFHARFYVAADARLVPTLSRPALPRRGLMMATPCGARAARPWLGVAETFNFDTRRLRAARATVKRGSFRRWTPWDHT